MGLSLWREKMAKLTIDDLKKIKEKTSKETSLRDGPANIKITVHMGTCGIAAGARDVMSALMEEMAEADRQDIRVVASGCSGMSCWVKSRLILRWPRCNSSTVRCLQLVIRC
jgi:hypothetical protein